MKKSKVILLLEWVVATHGRPIVCHTVVMTAHHIIKNVNYLIMKSDGQKTVGLHFFWKEKWKKNICWLEEK